MIDLSSENSSAEYESILPLVNVVFLLLIFFMLAGAFTTPDSIMVNPPISEVENKTEPRDALVLIDENANIVFDSMQLNDQELKENIILFLQNRNPDNISFKIKADAQSDSNKVIEVIELLQELKIKQVELLTIRQ